MIVDVEGACVWFTDLVTSSCIYIVAITSASTPLDCRRKVSDVKKSLGHEDRKQYTVRQGKGRKDRMTYLPQGVRPIMLQWISLRGDEPGALFWRIRKGSKLAPGYMDETSVRWILRRRAKEAGVENFSPHDLRRTYISNLLDADADIATVQRLSLIHI